ncbi:MAG: hypothetical protein ACC726_08150 [Chloroflexota bacterium]
MNVLSAAICEHASVREGLLTTVASGITRLYRSTLPGSILAFIAILVEVPPEDRQFPHEITIRITAPSGKEVFKLDGGFQVNPGPDTDPSETSLFPLPVDLRQIGADEYGWHNVDISIDSADPITLRFKVVQRPPQTGQTAPMSTPDQKLQH